jgi:Fe-S cluster biogenesis protein NfuA
MVSEETRQKVEAALDQVRPRLQMDGGNVRLVDIVDDVVQVELEGACKGCPMSQLTLQMGIERTVLKEVPEIKRVEDINSKMAPEMMDRFRKMYGAEAE